MIVAAAEFVHHVEQGKKAYHSVGDKTTAGGNKTLLLPGTRNVVPKKQLRIPRAGIDAVVHLDRNNVQRRKPTGGRRRHPDGSGRVLRNGSLQLSLAVDERGGGSAGAGCGGGGLRSLQLTRLFGEILSLNRGHE